MVLHEFNDPKNISGYGPHQQPEVRYTFYTTTESGDVHAVDSKGFFAAVAETAIGPHVDELNTKWDEHMVDLEDYADPPDDQQLRPLQRGRIAPASLAEILEAMKLMEAYNEQIKQHSGRNR
jgi:hypothetical protein